MRQILSQKCDALLSSKYISSVYFNSVPLRFVTSELSVISEWFSLLDTFTYSLLKTANIYIYIYSTKITYKFQLSFTGTFIFNSNFLLLSLS